MSHIFSVHDAAEAKVPKEPAGLFGDGAIVFGGMDMYIWIYIYICTHTYTYLFVCICVYNTFSSAGAIVLLDELFISVQTHMYIYIHIYVCVCAYIYCTLFGGCYCRIYIYTHMYTCGYFTFSSAGALVFGGLNLYSHTQI